MEFDELYRKWRWITYNELDYFLLSQMSTGNLPKNDGNEYSDNYYYKKYTNKIIEQFRNKDFNVGKQYIIEFDKRKRNEIKKLENCHLFYLRSFSRSEFIENCLINTANYSYEELKNKIKKNIVLYNWWDILTFEELSKNIINLFFLRSTRKLITESSLLNYFKTRFINRNEFITYLLENFEPRNKMIEEMNTLNRNFVVFDYEWLFSNDLKKSIRIFENECRLDYNEKIIGSFYNENILFREIKKKYENKYKVISQGSPEWLGLQRFDIYFPELNIALEYQGEQHQKPVDFGGKGKKIAKKQFLDNLKRDKLKKDKALKNNCEIVFVYPNYKLKEIINLLNSEIKKKENKL
jgi:hypothetical protein